MFLRTVQRFTRKFTLYPQNFFATTLNRLPFAKLGQDDISYFSSILQPHELITEQTELDQHNTDWKKNYKGNSSLMLRPNSTEKISKIMKYCNDKNLAVVPQGGNTGLVGGSVPIFDEIILSLSNLKKVHEFSPHSAVLTCDAGCILEDLNNLLAKDGFEVPLDLGAKGSCQIGGNIATHAGGIHFIKHGPFRGNILGLEVVLPDGQILNLESKVRKDNTGLDLKQMFIGSEGMLGIVTKANIQCVKRDDYSRVLFIRTHEYNEVLKIAELTRKVAGKNLSALEFLDDYAYYSVINHIPGVQAPFECGKNFEYYYVLVELAGSQPLDTLEEAYFDALSEAGLANDCVLCENDSQARNVWNIREQVATASNHMGSFLIYDFSVDITQWTELSNDIRERTKGKGFTVAYGHIGDGNLHVNIVYTEQERKKELMDILEPSTFDWLFKKKGSISAEHGIGFMKANFLNYAKHDNVIDVLKDVKNVFDPKGILNPYKVLPNSVAPKSVAIDYEENYPSKKR